MQHLLENAKADLTGLSSSSHTKRWHSNKGGGQKWKQAWDWVAGSTNCLHRGRLGPKAGKMCFQHFSIPFSRLASIQGLTWRSRPRLACGASMNRSSRIHRQAKLSHNRKLSQAVSNLTNAWDNKNTETSALQSQELNAANTPSELKREPCAPGGNSSQRPPFCSALRDSKQRIQLSQPQPSPCRNWEVTHHTVSGH